MDRKDIDQKYKWDLSVIYADELAFAAEYSLTEKKIEAYTKHEKTMSRGAGELLLALEDMTDIEGRIEKLWCYAYLGFAVDNSDNSAQARVARVRALAVKAANASWFLSPYLIKLDSSEVERWYKEEPRLLSYKRTIEKSLAEKPYTLSDECEKLMAKISDCFDSHEDIRGIFANSDLQFGRIKGADGKSVRITDANYVTFLMNSDRRVRRSAFACVYKTYAQFKNTFATMYYGYVKEQCALAKARGYKSSLFASTFKDEVTPTIYNNLIKSVRAALPTIHDYYELKREVLEVDKLHLYDVYAPLTLESERKFSYEEAIDEVLSTASVFGDEYYSILKAGLTERGWVDVFPTPGKRSGAFSAGCPYTEPYILLNYTDTFNDVSTLAHEAGHSMHSYFSRKYNEPHNSQYTIFVAEVASTVNELLLAHKRLGECEKREEKLSILDGLMETYKSTLYRQTMFAEFERDMHECVEKAEPLTADLLCSKYKRLVRAYFGKNVAIDKDIAYEWMRIPHFYSAFYVYKYATCISAASSIVKRIENEGEEYIKKYIDFLKCGGSRPPLESLAVAGIDMADPSVINGAIEDFASCIAQFRKIYNEK